MKKIFLLSTLLFIYATSFATISWMGNHYTGSQPDNSQTIYFYVEMWDSYGGCHAEVQIYYGGSWHPYAMTQGANNGNNSTWSANINVPSTATQYYFHGWDDWGANVWDSNGGSNYSIVINPTTASNGDWSNGATWCDGAVPSSTTAKYVIAHNVAADQTVTVGSAVINSSKTLTINTSQVFTTNGLFTVNGTMTVAGVFNTASGVINGNNVTVNGQVQILGGGYFTGSPTYGSSSTLYYKTYGSYNRSDEWTSATSGAGCPNNVQVIFNTTLNMGSSAALCTGYLAVMAGSTVNAPTNEFTIQGDLNNYGLFNVAVGAKVTVDGTLSNDPTTGVLVVKADASGYGSLIEHSGVAATVESYFTGNKWHFISAPVAGAVSGLFVGKYLQKFTESTNTYSDITSLTEPLTPGVGFALWGDNTGFGVSYTGNLNHGNVSRSLTRTTTGNNSGWNLIGNPYPSVLDWDAVGKENLNTAIYIENTPNWTIYNNGASVGAPDTQGSQYIAPGQGFFVQVAEGFSSGSVSMSDDDRVHNSTTFYKSAPVNNLARLVVSGNGYTDDIIVRFAPYATTEFDGDYDAHKFYSYIPEEAQIYTTGSTPLAINAVPMETSTVPMGIHATQSGTYTIAATELLDVPVIALEDLKTGIYTDLVAGPYTFSFETGEDEMRFMLHFGTTSVPETDMEVTGIYSLDKTIYVDLSKRGKGDVFIYNLAGQLVESKPSAGGLVNIGLNTTGVYVVKVVTGNAALTRKVWIR